MASTGRRLLYSSAAAGLIALVWDSRRRNNTCASPGWSSRRRTLRAWLSQEKAEFLWQSYAIGILGNSLAGLLELNVAAGDLTWLRPWLPMASPAPSTTRSPCASASVESTASTAVNEIRPFVASASAAAFLSALVWKLVPGDYLGLAWLSLGAAISNSACGTPRTFPRLSYVVSAGAFSRLLYFHVMLVRRIRRGRVAMSLRLAASGLLCRERSGLPARHGPIDQSSSTGPSCVSGPELRRGTRCSF